MKTIIQRRAENIILDDIRQFPIVGIIGPRQVGKTTLARLIMDKLGYKAVYLDLELQEDISKLENPEIYFEDHKDDCVILDEIQTMPELFPILRGMTDKYRIPGRFIILGSASPSLIRKSSDSLAGRISYTRLSPFNLLELGKSWDLKKHWFFGGFPEPYLTKDDSFSKKWIRSFIQTYTDRDLPLLGLPSSPTVTRRFLTMLANYQGGIWNASNFAKSMGLSYPTLNRYLDLLEEAFLVTRLQPYSYNIKKRLVKSPKVYIRDSGILHSLTSITDYEQLQGNVLIGNSWEGYVIEQIKQILSPEMDLYFYRTHNGAECDLVLVQGLSPISAIEIKYTSAPRISKGFNIAIRDLGTKENYIITPSTETYSKSDDIKVCNLSDYLDKFIPG
ncbi:MAG: ATP-binding protein [Bacteroidota bacterium]